MGDGRLGQLLLILRSRLEAISTDAHSAAAYGARAAALLKSVAHQSRGSASSLGLIGLAAALRDLELAVEQATASEGQLPDTIAAALRGLEATGLGVFAALAIRYPAPAGDHADGDAGALNR